jgi:hypothetical protein
MSPEKETTPPVPTDSTAQTQAAPQLVPAALTMGQMLAAETYHELCQEVERSNQSELLFTPEWDIMCQDKKNGILYYDLSGNISDASSTSPAGGSFTVKFNATDPIETIADIIGAVCQSIEFETLEFMRDGREYLQTLREM